MLAIYLLLYGPAQFSIHPTPSMMHKSLSVESSEFQTMWSAVVMFVLTFAVLGLLLGFAEIYDSPNGSERALPNPEASGSNATATAAASAEPKEMAADTSS